MCLRERKIPLDQRYMLRARARSAQAEDVNNVVRFSKAVFCSHTFGPLFNGIRFDFHGCSAFAADQMVVVRVWRAGPKQALAVLLQRVGVARSGEVAQGAIDSGETDGATGIAQRTVQRLGAHEAL